MYIFSLYWAIVRIIFYEIKNNLGDMLKLAAYSKQTSLFTFILTPSLLFFTNFLFMFILISLFPGKTICSCLHFTAKLYGSVVAHFVWEFLARKRIRRLIISTPLHAVDSAQYCHFIFTSSRYKNWW